MVSLTKVVILALGYWQRTYLPCRGRQFFEKAFKESILYTINWSFFKKENSQLFVIKKSFIRQKYIWSLVFNFGSKVFCLAIFCKSDSPLFSPSFFSKASNEIVMIDLLLNNVMTTCE